MKNYQVKLNDDVLFSGGLHDCLRYLVERFGSETLADIYETGYRIE